MSAKMNVVATHPIELEIQVCFLQFSQHSYNQFRRLGTGASSWVNYIYGLAGRDFTVTDAYEIFNELEEMVTTGKEVEQYRYIGLRK